MSQSHLSLSSRWSPLPYYRCLEQLSGLVRSAIDGLILMVRTTLDSPDKCHEIPYSPCTYLKSIDIKALRPRYSSELPAKYPTVQIKSPLDKHFPCHSFHRIVTP